MSRLRTILRLLFCNRYILYTFEDTDSPNMKMICDMRAYPEEMAATCDHLNNHLINMQECDAAVVFTQQQISENV